MTTATQPERQVSGVGDQASGENRIPRTQHLEPRALRALHAEWRKLSPGLQGSDECQGTSDKSDPERALRLGWTNQQLVTRHSSLVTSWSQLTIGQAKFLLKKMREESGDSAAYRALLIGKLAARLWPGNWDEMLRERLLQRFRVPTPDSLLPHQAHEIIEELLSRIAREEGVGIEDLRREIRRGGARPSGKMNAEG